jgi:hydrogenase maturation factor
MKPYKQQFQWLSYIRRVNGKLALVDVCEAKQEVELKLLAFAPSASGG